MVKWIGNKLEEETKLGKIVEDLLDELLAKDSKSETGTDNMSAILVKFDKTYWFALYIYWLWARL